MLLYESIARQIVQEIQEKSLPHGYKLETLDQLTERFNTSKNTIVRALETLEAHGHIYQIRGSGSFIRRRKRNYYLDLLSHQGYQSSLKKLSLTSKLISKEIIPAPEFVCKELDVDLGEPLVYIKRLHYIGNFARTLCIEKSYYKQSVVADLPLEAINDSIFDYIQNELDVMIGFSDTYIKVEKLKKQEADLLKLHVNDPALVTEEIYYTKYGEPFDYSEATYNYEEAYLYAQASSFDK